MKIILNNLTMKFGLIAGLVLVLLTTYFISTQRKSVNSNLQTKNQVNSTNILSVPILNKVNEPSVISESISNALSRITKKPFGIKVSPQNSPVSPEKFSGFHTGVDFETTPEEQNVDVPVYAICSGPLALKKWASGYGGVVVQKCEIEKKAVTVIYGHIKLLSVTADLDNVVNAGQKLGILGKGYSSETDGERKHLHLGIHMGTRVNILGYVQKSADLNQWLDAEKLLKK